MPRRITIPLNFGRQDKVAPKHAPFGVLKTAKNLRHRQLGGLGLRHAYAPLPMDTRNGTLVAYDLHEINGRLIALGSDEGDGFPTDLFEYVGLESESWRAIDPETRRVNISPFTNLRGIGGIAHPEGGVTLLDSAAGGGYVCVLYKTANGNAMNALVVRQDNDQTILHDRAVGGGLVSVTGRVTYAGGKFFVLGAGSGNAVKIDAFEPGTDEAFATFYEVDGSSANAVTALDIVPVGNPDLALLVAAFDRGSSSDLEIHVVGADGNQVGSTISVASTNTIHISLEADEGADEINLYTVEGTDTGQLRTFDFAGNLDNGPTATATGASGQICRVLTDEIAVAVNTSGGDVAIAYVTTSTHFVDNEQTIQSAVMQTRLVSGASASETRAVCFAGIISPKGDGEDATNVLFYTNPSTAHMVQRDYLGALALSTGAGLHHDTSTGRLVWTAATDDGSGLKMPSIAIADFMSAARRQSAKFGGLLYFAGAPPLVYDGRFLVEPGFELPGIISITPSNGSGSLTNSATYSYQVHFEYTLADGSIIEGPPSAIENVTMGASDDTNTLVVQTPHCLALVTNYGAFPFGANVTAVVSRTEWSPDTVNLSTGATGAQLSVMRRAKTMAVPFGMGNYGEPLSIVDTISDADLADEAPIYTQSARGALSGTLEHNLPQACSFITASESRLHTGGLVRSHEVQASKAAFLGSCFNWAEFSPFFATVGARVRGLQSLDQVRFVFVEDNIFALDGAAPDDLGKGAVNDPVEVPTPGGLKDWRSLLKGPDGLWFQLDDDKIFRIPRGGGAPEWMGADIVELLRDFPTVTAAARHTQDNCLLFALNNSAGTGARIAVRDLLHSTWLVDEPPLESSSGIDAMVVYGRTVAYLSGGVVYAQSDSSFTEDSDFIDAQLVTQPIYPFELGGYGIIHDILSTNEFHGACSLNIRYSLDDGLNFNSLVGLPEAISGLTSGARVQRRRALPQDVTSSIVFEVSLTGSAGSEGLILNGIDLLVEDVPDLAQLAPADSG